MFLSLQSSITCSFNYIYVFLLKFKSEAIKSGDYLVDSVESHGFFPCLLFLRAHELSALTAPDFSLVTLPASLPALCLRAVSCSVLLASSGRGGGARGPPAVGCLVPAEISGSQEMRHPSNILTRNGGGQWSGCVCVNTRSPNTHTRAAHPPHLHPNTHPELILHP